MSDFFQLKNYCYFNLAVDQFYSTWHTELFKFPGINPRLLQIEMLICLDRAIFYCARKIFLALRCYYEEKMITKYKVRFT